MTKGDNRPAVYAEGDVAVYRISAVGMHEHALCAARLGFAPQDKPKWLLERFAEGHLHEDSILERVGGVENGQAEVEIEVIPGKVILRGHIDGQKDGAVVEAKALSKDEFARFGRQGIHGWPRYVMQCVLYMAGLDLGYCTFAVKDRNSGEIKVREYSWTDLDGDKVLAQAKQKVLAIEAAARKGELIDATGCEDWPCDYGYLHRVQQGSLEDAIEGTVEDGLIDSLAAAERKLWQKKREAEAAYNEAKERLVSVLDGRESVRTKQYEIRQTVVQQERFDTRKHQENDPECHGRYVLSVGYTRLGVKDQGQGQSEGDAEETRKEGDEE